MRGLHCDKAASLRSPSSIRIENSRCWFGLSLGGVKIIENDRKPNYTFRVANNDRDVAIFLVNLAKDKLGAKKFAILNEGTGWGVPAIDTCKPRSRRAICRYRLTRPAIG